MMTGLVLRAGAWPAVAGISGVALTGVVGSPDAPPLIVSLGVAVLAVPAFFLNAPAWVTAVEEFAIAATVTALVLVHQQGRRPA